MRGWTLVVAAESILLAFLVLLWLLGSEGHASGSGELSTLNEGLPTTERLHSADAERMVRDEAPRLEQPVSEEPIASNAILVVGTVRDLDGQTIGGARISFQHYDTWCHGSSAANGAFAVPALSAGSWKASCKAEGFTESQIHCDLDGRPQQRVDFQLRASALVHVLCRTTNGESLLEDADQRLYEHLSVVASETPLDRDFPRFSQRMIEGFGIGEFESLVGYRAKKESEYTVPPAHLWIGDLHVRGDILVYANLYYRHLRLQTQAIAAGQREVVFVLEPDALRSRLSEVRVRVVEAETGQPIVGLHVDVSDSQSFGFGTKTDQEGRARITRVAPGTGEIRIGMKERENFWREVEIPVGETVDLGEIALHRELRVEGVVVDASDRPVAGASISSIALDSWKPGGTMSSRSSAKADSEGRFTLSGLGSRRYRLQVSGDDNARGYAVVELASEDLTNVRIVLRAASMKIPLRSAAEPLQAYIVTAFDANDIPVSSARMGGTHSQDYISVPPGRTTFEIHDGNGALQRRFSLDVSAAEPTAIDVP